jgi:uncharacterized phiE125 gp8 family phage protein
LLQQAKEALRIDHADEDALLSAYLAAAVEYCEARLNQALITQTKRLILPRWGTAGVIALPYPPLRAIESVKYYDDGVLTTWEAANYVVDIQGRPGRLWPAEGVGYPSHDARPDAIQITFECGWGNAATDVPEIIRIAIEKIVHDLYEDRSTGMEIRGDRILDRLLAVASIGHEM